MKSYQDYLIETLKNPEEAIGYLNAVLETKDPRMFLVALRNVAEAHGGMVRLSKKTRMSRSNLYKMLSKKGHPEIQSLFKVLEAFGFSLAVSIKGKDRKRSIFRKAA